MTSKDWKLAVTGVPCQMVETLITGIGQAYLLATPLQLAVMTARLCNGGIAVMPKLSRRIDSGTGGTGNDDRLERAASLSTSRRNIGVSAGNLQIIMNGMSEVVNGKRGTARKYQLDKELDMRMAGKTGTSQVRRISKAERKAGGKLGKKTPWKERDHALFTAFAPVSAPRYATCVVVEHGGSGTYAAQLTKDIMTEVLSSDPLSRSALGFSQGSGSAARGT